MDIIDEREARKRRGSERGALGVGTRGAGTPDFEHFLEEHFEEPEQSDILVEKQVKEGKEKK